MFRKMLLAIDGRESSERAFQTALELAEKFGAEMLLVSVIEDLPRYAEESLNGVDEMLEQGKQHFEELQRDLVVRAERAGVKTTTFVLPGRVVETVVGVAEKERVDLIVLGGEGHSGVLRRVSSLTGVQIAHHASCAALIMR